MVLRRWSSLGPVSPLAAALASILCAAFAICCASNPPARIPPAAATPPASPVPASSPTPAASPLSGLDGAAALLELEDRRAFDEPLLSALARSAEVPLRARAALCLGRLGDERAEPILAGLLGDSAPAVRATAAFASGLVPGGNLTASLSPLLSDPDRAVAAAAARAIGDLGRPEGEEALIAALPGAAPDLAAPILQALWRFSNGASETAALAQVSSPEPRVHAAALYALSRKPREGSLAVLTAALADSQPDVAAAAARGLGVLGRKESAEPLAQALTSRTPVVINALAALDAIFEKAPDVPLSDAGRSRVLTLAADANTNVAVAALPLLRRFPGDREASRRLWSIALSGEGLRREVALKALAAALKSEARSAIESAAASPDPFVRAAAADAVAFLPPEEARPFRERFAESRDLAVRLANLSSLATPASVRENRPLVNSALTDPDPGMRSTAVDALALLGEPGVIPLFADAASRARSDAAPDVFLSVIGACEKLHEAPEAAALVESIYREGPTLARRSARRALVTTFGRSRADLPLPEYTTGRTRADYSAILTEAARGWLARVETAGGVFTLRLLRDEAPMTVMNFVSLAKKGYFDGVRIHRVVPNFVLQDGDPTGTGNGGPGWEIRDEISPREYVRGAVGMALSGPDTGGSQWFVTHSPQPHLNDIYPVFGYVAEGQGALERIGQGEKIVRVTVSAGR